MLIGISAQLLHQNVTTLLGRGWDSSLMGENLPKWVEWVRGTAERWGKAAERLSEVGRNG
jgi:hypothetical protein